MISLPEQLWQRLLEAFSRTAPPAVTPMELSLVLAAAITLSIPRQTWRYFGLLATATHELGHAFAALLSGQRLAGIHLRLDHSGTTTSYSRRPLAAVWSGFWGYPVPALVGAAFVWSGLSGWGPATLVTGALVLLVSLIFIRNPAGVLITAACVLCSAALVLWVPAVFIGHTAIILGLALLVAAVRDLIKLANVHLRRRDRLASSDAYLLYRATSVPSFVWIVLFTAVVAGSWVAAWVPISTILAGGT